ncbi:MAG: hypothetical protein ACFCUL_12885 [Flavobacteriaceae bacterium]
MRSTLGSVFVLILALFGTMARGQEGETLSFKIAQFQVKKERVAQLEREALKNEVEKINRMLDLGEVSKTEAEELKRNAAEKHAKNIENKIAILDNSIALLERSGSIELNTEIKGVQISIAGGDENGDVLFGVNYNSGKQKTVKYDQRTYGDPVLAFGFNNALIEGGSFEDSPYKVGGSRFFEIGWAWRTRVFKNTNFLRFHYGVSFQFNGLKPINNQYFVLNNGQTELQDFDFDLKKSKFRMDNLVIPVHFEFGSSRVTKTEERIRYSINKKFRVGLGAYAGINIGTIQKLKYDMEGKSVKDKLNRDYNTSNLIYGLSGYMGFDGVLLYAKYDLNPIFQDATVTQRNISLGLRFDLE